MSTGTANNISKSKLATAVTVRTPKVQTLRDFLKIWDYRYLLKTLVWRDLKARYRHTTLGILWFVLQPLILMLVISVGFRFIISGDVEGLPYPLYVASGLVLWSYFANSFPQGSMSLESNSSMIQKITFPHACLPLVPVVTAIVDMMAASLLLIPMLVYYEIIPSWRVLLLPFIVFGTGVFIYGFTLLTSAASAVYKDLRNVIPFIGQLMFFGSPVFISHEGLQGRISTIFMLNPFSTYLDAFRWAIFPTSTPPSMQAVVVCAAFTVTLFFVGLTYFQRQQSTLADIL